MLNKEWLFSAECVLMDVMRSVHVCHISKENVVGLLLRNHPDWADVWLDEVSLSSLGFPHRHTMVMLNTSCSLRSVSQEQLLTLKKNHFMVFPCVIFINLIKKLNSLLNLLRGQNTLITQSYQCNLQKILGQYFNDKKQGLRDEGS